MAALQFVFDIDRDDADSFRVTARARDISLWERTHPGRSLAGLERDASLSQLEEIAHVAATRLGMFEGTLAQFRASCDVSPVDPNDLDDGSESGPTRSAP